MIVLRREACHALSLQYQGSASVTPHPVTMFEHGIVGQSIKHAHLHILPAVVDLSPRIRADFPKSEVQELLDAAQLQELYAKRSEPYIFWTVPSGRPMVCWNPPAPPQYMRLIVSEILGCPERGNWRNCDPETDKRLVKTIVARLKPYFP